MNLGVLTSSRADFGIYLSLLRLLEASDKFDLTIIAFGTHVSKTHGETISEIRAAGFVKIDSIPSLLADDSPKGISASYALTNLKFSEYWSKTKYDLVLCLGDRFEMQAAVQAGIPLGVKYAHFHGGETTEGAIDNIYRHQITLASEIHFTSTAPYAERVAEIIGFDENIFNIGSLSLDNLEELDLPQIETLKLHFGIPEGDYILATFHPETVAFDENLLYSDEMCRALELLSKSINIVITMPNADTMGSLYRQKLIRLKERLRSSLTLVENFGKLNYFSALKSTRLVLGNSSSGIIEAASFNKYVVNVGDRQKGRIQSENVVNSAFDSASIVQAVEETLMLAAYNGENAYKKGQAAQNTLKILESLA